MDISESIDVDCKEHGVKTLQYSTANCSAANIGRLRAKLETCWPEYWQSLLRVTGEMAKDVQGVYDFDASFESHKFEIEIYDFDFSPGVEYLSFRVEFHDSDSQVMCPVFDTSFHGFEVNHTQPVF